MSSKGSPDLAPPSGSQARWTWDQLVNQVVDTSPAPTQPKSVYVGANALGNEAGKKEESRQDAPGPEPVKKETDPLAEASLKQSNVVSSLHQSAGVENTNVQHGPGDESTPAAAQPSTIAPKMSEEALTISRAFTDVDDKDNEVKLELSDSTSNEARLSHPASDSGSSTVNEEQDEEQLEEQHEEPREEPHEDQHEGEHDEHDKTSLSKTDETPPKAEGTPLKTNETSSKTDGTPSETDETKIDECPSKIDEANLPTHPAHKGGIIEEIDNDIEAGSQAIDKESIAALKVPYSAFPVKAKRIIVLGAASASIFAPLSMQIYLPSLNELIDEFNVSKTKMDLTVSVYMIFMAISPMVIGGLADISGRRPTLMICFAIYIVSCVLLAMCHGYSELMAFRIIQSIGASPTIAIASAVVADIVTSAERGSYAALVAVPVIFAPTLGPVIGGLLTEFLGWRSIFWFLLIAGSLALILLFLFFPETCRVIVGDASASPPKLYRSVLQGIRNNRPASTETATMEKARLRGQATRKQRMREAMTSGIRVLFTKERFYLLVYVGIVFSGFSAIATEMPTQLKAIYGYDSLMVGIMYLPMAGGAIISTIIVGRQMNKNFRRHAKRLGINIEEGQQIDMNSFPAEHARLEVALPSLLICTVGMLCWGWVLKEKTSVAAPCILLFFLGVGLNGVMASTNALLMDISQTQAGAVMAASNLTRCALGAVASAVIQPMINAVGIQWAYMIYGCLYLGFAPLLALQYFKGHQWRKQAKEREDKKREIELAAQGLSGNEDPATVETRSVHSKHEEREAHEGLTGLRFSTLYIFPSRPDKEVAAAVDATVAAPVIPLVPVSRPSTVKEESVKDSMVKE